MFPNTSLRQVQESDKRAIRILLDYKDRVHRHLDWRSPLDLLDESPFFVVEQDLTIQGALACPEDPSNVAWIRFFATIPGLQTQSMWRALFDASLKTFTNIPDSIVSVAVQPWYLNLLLDEGFSLYQTIVVLFLNTPAGYAARKPPDISISPMNETDLEEVITVDHAAFEPIWRNSMKDLFSAYQNSAYATIARLHSKIIGYQISSATPLNAHLARLAVLPDLQGKQIGTLLTYEMIRHYNDMGISYITVNTQGDNHASLNLYRKLGFTLSHERFPVLRYYP